MHSIKTRSIVALILFLSMAFVAVDSMNEHTIATHRSRELSKETTQSVAPACRQTFMNAAVKYFGAAHYDELDKMILSNVVNMVIMNAIRMLLSAFYLNYTITELLQNFVCMLNLAFSKLMQTTLVRAMFGSVAVDTFLANNPEIVTRTLLLQGMWSGFVAFIAWAFLISGYQMSIILTCFRRLFFAIMFSCLCLSITIFTGRITLKVMLTIMFVVSFVAAFAYPGILLHAVALLSSMIIFVGCYYYREALSHPCSTLFLANEPTTLSLVSLVSTKGITVGSSADR